MGGYHENELFFSQPSYLKKVVERFRMLNAKVFITSLGQDTKLLFMQYPQRKDENKTMESIPYGSGVGSIMYNMVYSITNLTHAISIVIHFYDNFAPCSFRCFEVGVKVFEWLI